MQENSQEKSPIKRRILQFIDNKGITQYEFYQKTGITRGVLTQNNGISEDNIARFLAYYTDISPEWLLTGEGTMFKSGIQARQPASSQKRLIPFYDDVATIGGINGVMADTDNTPAAPELIDAGDWFPEATAAIRHYGDSMLEYPSGSILAIKRVQDARLIINGRNYVIETSEFRITKQLQDDGGDYIMAYSSNTATYPDGRQIHSPIRIPKETIRHLDLVLGCVTKEFAGNEIYSR